jgi:hypothetical protein
LPSSYNTLTHTNMNTNTNTNTNTSVRGIASLLSTPNFASVEPVSHMARTHVDACESMLFPRSC